MLAASFVLVILKFCSHASAQTTGASGAGVGDSLPAGHLYGEAGLTTNWIENGVSQTDKGFALQSGLGYKWTQFRTGLWGSNVKFPGSDDTLNLRLYLMYKFVFTNNADLNVRYDFNKYFSAGDRNGSLIGLDLNIFKYHVLLDQNSNFEGGGQSRRWGFMKDYQIPWNLNLNVNAGYNMVSDAGFTNYFDVKTQATYRYADITYALGNSFNSGSSQFGGRGDIAFFLSLGAQF